MDKEQITSWNHRLVRIRSNTSGSNIKLPGDELLLSEINILSGKQPNNKL
jgi:hypothetical protein